MKKIDNEIMFSARISNEIRQCIKENQEIIKNQYGSNNNLYKIAIERELNKLLAGNDISKYELLQLNFKKELSQIKTKIAKILNDEIIANVKVTDSVENQKIRQLKAEIAELKEKIDSAKKLNKTELLRLICEYKKIKKYFWINSIDNNELTLSWTPGKTICDELVDIIDRFNVHPIEWEILCTNVKIFNKSDQDKYSKIFAPLFDKYGAICIHCKKEININDVKFLAKYDNKFLVDCPNCKKSLLLRNPESNDN